MHHFEAHPHSAISIGEYTWCMKNAPPLTQHERIAELARRIYEQEGCPEGQAEVHWERVEPALRLLKSRVFKPAESESFTRKLSLTDA